MTLTAVISIVTCTLMVLAVLFFPKIKIGKFSVGSYWVATLLGALALLLTGCVSLTSVAKALLADTAINPIKILALFISLTILSIFLDELGFFRFLANATLRKAGVSQLKLFLLLYITVSVLTVFTSNDIIILSFTPFICYFAKNAKISPIPYLAAEFVAANSWSMALIIGNPTNIYLVTSANVDFISYLKVMLFPTIACGIVSLLCLLLVFGKKLKTPICASPKDVTLQDPIALWIGIAHLFICTLLLAVGSYIGLEMWLVTLIAFISLFLWISLLSCIRRSKPRELIACLKRAPWELIPFILTMFVLVEAWDANQMTDLLFQWLNTAAPVWTYGITSFLASNLVNNIPMSVLYSSVLSNGSPLSTVYATVVGSNLGACLTPIGALAGIMWSSILKEHGLKFGYCDFLKIGITVAVPGLITSLLVLQWIL